MGDLHRPGYHFTPPANWMNDPNGMVYYDGEYHLFYQHHPHSRVWGPMHWGHAVSRDLVKWQHLPVALSPDEQGMIFSGSAVVDWQDTAGFGREALVAVFTYHKDKYETQNLAYSTDRGRTWTKYKGNPVLTPLPETPDFRDPKVFWHFAHWVMALAAGKVILFFTSPNLRQWTPSGSFGPAYGASAGIWETPDLFQLTVDDSSESRWVLTVGVVDGGPAGKSGTQYFIGQFDGRSFTSENPPETILWADHGADYYAAQSWSDEPQGRRIMLGWLNNWQYAIHTPTSPWRGALSLPRKLALAQTEHGIRLIQSPIPELKSLRGAQHHWQNEILPTGSNLLVGLEYALFEINAEVELGPKTDLFGFRVRVGAGESTIIGCDLRQGKLFVDRTRSGQVDFHPAFAAVHSTNLNLMNRKLTLHIFVDRSSVEVFAQGGAITFSESLFPAPHSQGLEVFVEGDPIHLKHLDVYEIKATT